jgi:hypothetical protein
MEDLSPVNRLHLSGFILLSGDYVFSIVSFLINSHTHFFLKLLVKYSIEKIQDISSN